MKNYFQIKEGDLSSKSRKYALKILCSQLSPLMDRLGRLMVDIAPQFSNLSDCAPQSANVVSYPQEETKLEEEKKIECQVPVMPGVSQIHHTGRGNGIHNPVIEIEQYEVIVGESTIHHNNNAPPQLQKNDIAIQTEPQEEIKNNLK